ncbi:DUF881 domain-containing protein [Isoptericola aurantiacus]|uniref:DUF881 domain-containing protein n=1 Tax=Isoptericola aurantiacus TaxID=3377839 RepID=UPI00383A8B75
MNEEHEPGQHTDESAASARTPGDDVEALDVPPAQDPGTPTDQPSDDVPSDDDDVEAGAAGHVAAGPVAADRAVEPDQEPPTPEAATTPADPLDLSVPVSELAVDDDQLWDASAASAAVADGDPADPQGGVEQDAAAGPDPLAAGPDDRGEPDPFPDGLERRSPDGDAAPSAAERPRGWHALLGTTRPRANRSQVLVMLLCAALGFALVVQVQQSSQDPLSSARQDDLVRLLDEVTQRSEQLEDEVVELSQTRDELRSGSGQAQAAVDLAEERAASEGILSGRLPATGPGLEIVISDPDGLLPAAKMFNVLEELRNAGAEVVELNGLRLVTSTWFLDADGGILVDGVRLQSPYRWTVIGDPATLSPALEIPGGALATVRTEGAEATTNAKDVVEVTAVREPAEPQYATPQRPDE